MNFSALLCDRFLASLQPLTDDAAEFAGMIRVAGDPKFGDYQFNAAMPLGKRIGKPPRAVAADIIGKLQIEDLCDHVEVAGPGFINLKIRDQVIVDQLCHVVGDDRGGVGRADDPMKIVIDYSSPNVAKPMHVGHIRSTVIGDALSRLFRFAGHHVVTDNHLGDWGTQFGIIIYGYKHFGDADVVDADPVPELAKLYRLTNQLIEYQKAKSALPSLESKLRDAENIAAAARADFATAHSDAQVSAKEQKKIQKNAIAAEGKVKALRSEIQTLSDKIRAVDSDPDLAEKTSAHAEVPAAVLRETAKLHEGDPENITLWKRFLPFCKDEINRVYDRLNVSFDHTLGESFYHDRLPEVVKKLTDAGLTTISDGAVCVFLEGFDSPMIVQKRDGAYLYATTDLATLLYRHETFDPDKILYVVDSRQSEHFVKFFAMSEPMGLSGIDLVHVSFGTVLGADGKPMKTRSGSLIGLESLLDDAVAKAKQVVCSPEHLATMDPPMLEEEQDHVAEIVGIGAIKYADLSHHRTSDYRFDVDKMVALEGNTATYIQYSYARTRGILRKAAAERQVDDMDGWILQHLQPELIEFREQPERTLAIALMRMEEAIDGALATYLPNQMCDYLFETAKAYSSFNESCRVIGNIDPVVAMTRLALVLATSRVLKIGLGLLGIDVVERM